MFDRPEPEFIEILGISETFCDGLASVEVGASGFARLTFFAEQRSLHSGTIEKHIVVQLVMPQAALVEATAKILAATSDVPKPIEWPSHLRGGRA